LSAILTDNKKKHNGCAGKEEKMRLIQENTEKIQQIRKKK
jgi:hypothetical protein